MCKECHPIRTILLNVHHIKPRDKGGSNRSNNLISLCLKCHDIAEKLQLTKKQIVDFNCKPEINFMTCDKTDDWHKWVYGGYKLEN
jgi:hypothetical protein